MKLGRLALPALAATLFALPATAQTVFVDEDFESYASQGAFQAVWAPEAGDGFSGGAGSSATLETSGLTGQTGNAALGVGGQINEEVNGFNPATNPGGYQVVPSATENVILRGDLFALGTQSNSLAGTDQSFRQTLGLRSDIFDRDPDPGINASGVNFLELGFYNVDSCVPTNPGCVGPDPGDPEAEPPVPPTEGDPEFRPNGDFMFRLVLFDSGTIGNYFENGVDQGTAVQSPNWANFPLDPLLDDPTTVLPNGSVPNDDGVVNLIDIGDGWHTYEAVVSDSDVTLTLDLFRDGINNVTGAPGVDSEVVFEIEMAPAFNDPPFDLDPAPFNSLRIGGPSGVSSLSGFAGFDNIYLALEEATVDPGLMADFNGDGTVDLLDLDILGANFGGPGDMTTGDANGDGNVDLLDLDILGTEFGMSAASAVPEPTAAMLVVTSLGLLAARRR